MVACVTWRVFCFLGNDMKQFKLNVGETKPFKTIQEQLELLSSRGLTITDPVNAAEVLTRTNYYRFSAYSLTLRTNDKFHKGTTFDNIYELYRFDDAFRKIVMEFSSYVEIYCRSCLSYTHGEKYGPLGYMDSKNFEHPYYFAQFITTLSKEITRSDDVFVEHHKRKRNSTFPIWAALECSSFGDLSKLYKNLKNEDKNHIAKTYFNRSRQYIENWLQVCVYARNIAAHGGRFYNRRLKSIPVKFPSKYTGVLDSTSAFACIYAIHQLQPTSALAEKLRHDLAAIFQKYPFALKKHMGFPDNWSEILTAEAQSNQDKN